MRGRRVLLHVAAGARAPVTLTLDGASARLVRVPVDVGVGFRPSPGAAWSWRADLGLRTTGLLVDGRGLERENRAFRLDVGARLATSVTYTRLPEVAPFVGVEAVVNPRPYELLVTGRGEIGRTPTLWCGVIMGVAFGDFAP